MKNGEVKFWTLECVGCECNNPLLAVLPGNRHAVFLFQSKELAEIEATSFKDAKGVMPKVSEFKIVKA